MFQDEPNPTKVVCARSTSKQTIACFFRKNCTCRNPSTITTKNSQFWVLHSWFASCLSKTNWQFKMADNVNIYNRHVYQHNRKQMPKSNILNYWNLKIMVAFLSHLVHDINLISKTLENITNNIPLGYTHASHNYSHIFVMVSLCRCLIVINLLITWDDVG